MTAVRISPVWWKILLTITIFLVSISAQAQTSRYVFLPNQSTLVQKGGIAGVHWTYMVEGQFLLTVDSEAGTALFTQVDANAVDDSPLQRTLDPNEVFNMAALAGTIVDSGASIRFGGNTDNGSSVLITLTLTDDTVTLKGETTPPPNSADFFIFTLDAVAQRKYSGGTGEPNNPYQIATAEDLMLLGESPEDYDKHFIMTANIDLDPNLPGRKVFDGAVIPSFRGTFDGNNLTISHLRIDGGDYLGLFGRLSSRAEVKDLGVVDVNVTSSGDYVGGLVGYTTLGCYLTKCYSTGSVTGVNYVGGLVGSNWAPDIATGFGPFVPESFWSTIYNCYSTAYVSGNTSVGGLLGSNWGDVTQCYSNAVVTGIKQVGGLAGANRGAGTIARCYAICTIRKAFPRGQTDESIGGLVGTNFGTPGSSGIWSPYDPAIVALILDCYSIVSGDSQVSGLLVGKNGDSKDMYSTSPGRIVNCYATCDSSGTVEASGFVGRSHITLLGLNCFWDAQACGEYDNNKGGTPKTTAEMQTASTFLEAGWDFVDEMENGTDDIWWIDEGQDYPRLWWETAEQ